MYLVPDRDDTAPKNQTLLKAAPDMYALLKDIIACLPELWGDQVIDGMITITLPADLIDDVETVILCAEGEL